MSRIIISVIILVSLSAIFVVSLSFEKSCRDQWLVIISQAKAAAAKEDKETMKSCIQKLEDEIQKSTFALRLISERKLLLSMNQQLSALKICAEKSNDADFLINIAMLEEMILHLYRDNLPLLENIL